MMRERSSLNTRCVVDALEPPALSVVAAVETVAAETADVDAVSDVLSFCGSTGCCTVERKYLPVRPVVYLSAAMHGAFCDTVPATLRLPGARTVSGEVNQPEDERMMLRRLMLSTIAATLVTTLAACSAIGTSKPTPGMSFFITSVNPGKGANLGGLAGADTYCATLAAAAGAPARTWRAYLSTSTENARDRIGKGPWANANGVVVATSVRNLHSDKNKLNKANSLDENGQVINGRGDEPNRHDILTGSDADGKAVAANCNNWTSNGQGSAMVGHHDRTGGGDAPASWNAAHGSRGCDIAGLRSTGGDGLFYCFAAD
jgi:hypothetical protein